MIAPHLDGSFRLESMFKGSEPFELAQFPVFTSKEDLIKCLSSSKYEIFTHSLKAFVDSLIDAKGEWVHGGYIGSSNADDIDSESKDDYLYFRLCKMNKEVYKITELF